MPPDHFFHLLGHFKTVAKNATKRLYALRKIKSMKPNSVHMQAKAPSLKNSPELTEYLILKNFVEAYSKHNPPPLLVFADSVFLRVADDDQSSQSLGNILEDHYQNKVFLISGSGYHSSMFERFSEVLSTLPARPRMAVVPINLRSFSPTWDLNPLYQFHSEIELLSSFGFKQSGYKLQVKNSSSEMEDHLMTSMKLDGEKIITLGKFLDIIRESPAFGSDTWKRRLMTIFQYHYMYPVNSEHRKIKSLKQIIRQLNGDGVAVYCYITPINYEAGSEYCGEIFLEAVKKNLTLIRQEVESELSAALVGNDALMFRFDDFAFRFTRNIFFTSHNATEHLRFAGRNFIAQRIVEAEQALLRTDGY